MKTFALTLSQAENFVSTFRHRNAKAKWEGWDLIISTPNPAGWRTKDGRFIGGKWHRTFTITPDDKGMYRIPIKYANRG